MEELIEQLRNLAGKYGTKTLNPGIQVLANIYSIQTSEGCTFDALTLAPIGQLDKGISALDDLAAYGVPSDGVVAGGQIITPPPGFVYTALELSAGQVTISYLNANDIIIS
jgi:hypothetical protein